MRPVAWSLRTRSRQAVPATEADPGRQRHGGAPRGGLPVAREGPRLASVASRLTSATYSRLAPVGAPPSPRGGGNKTKDTRGAASATGRRELRFDKNCGSKEFEGVVAGRSDTGLFDIVNRGSAASRRPRSSGRQRLRVSRTTRATRSYPPPCGEGRPPKRSEGGRGGGRCCWTHLAQQLRPPPPTPPHKGEGSRPSSRRVCASNSKLSADPRGRA